MSFKKYQHLERFGTPEVQNIELGECYIFPKIDGTNSSIWFENGQIHCGSRNRELSLENDNAGFMAWVLTQKKFLEFFTQNPTMILYGEWLVPHSLKTYRENAWRDFYVFDVMFDMGNENCTYLHYSDYEPLISEYGISYIPPISIIKNASYEGLISNLEKNVFLIQDGKGVGEGIVIKRYDYKNKYGRTTWAKIVTSEFKEKHTKEMGTPKSENKIVEQDLAEKFVTTALVEKEYAKICNEFEWSSKLIPKLLNLVYYSLIKEDMWEILKDLKSKVIDFDRLKYFVFMEVRKKKSELF